MGDNLVPNLPPRRRPMGTVERAEALFKAATDRPQEQPRKTAAVPGVRETVSLRLDREVLGYFQDEGPGWQERINAALRKAAGLE